MSFTPYKALTALALTISAGGAALFVGCSSDDTSSPNPDAGASGPKQSGTIVDLLSPGHAISGATVSLGSNGSAQADSSGAYSIAVSKNTPFYMRVASPGYVSLIEEEWQLAGDANRGQTNLLDSNTGGTLVTTLPGLDTAKGVLAVGAIKGTCSTEAGATIAVDAAGQDAGTSNQVIYFQAGTVPAPAPDNHTQANAVTLSAIVYNLALGAVKLNVTAPTGCTVKSFPVTDPLASNIQYTGNMQV